MDKRISNTILKKEKLQDLRNIIRSDMKVRRTRKALAILLIKQRTERGEYLAMTSKERGEYDRALSKEYRDSVNNSVIDFYIGNCRYALRP